MKNASHYLLLLVSVLLISCSKDSGSEPEIPTPLPEVKMTQVAYGDGARHKMDVFLPKGRDKQTKVVVLLHGGTWISGDKRDLAAVQQQLLDENIASINLNYHFASLSHHYDDMMQDVSLALAEIKENAPEWGIRATDYHLMGVSSGAHLALLYAYEFQKSGEIKSVISIAGPTALASLTTDPLLTILLAQVLIGVPPQDLYVHPRFLRASPITHAENATPTLLIHGTADEIVPYAQSVQLRDALAEAGIAHRLVSLEGASHDVQQRPDDMTRIYDEVLLWLSL